MMNSAIKPAWKLQFPEFDKPEETLAEALGSLRLPQVAYLEWASEHYQLPVLQDDFFKDINIQVLMDKFPSPAWNKTMFPASEWDGVLYIACIEPQDLNLQQEFCFVLASYESLQKAWIRLPKKEIETEAKPFRSSLLETPVPDASKLNLDFASLDLSPTIAQDNSTAANNIEDDAEITTEIPLFTELPPLAPPSASTLPSTASTPQLTQKSSELDPLKDFKFSIESTQTSTTPAPGSQISVTLSKKETVTQNIPAHLMGQAPVTLVKTSAPVAPKMDDISFTSTKTIMPFPEKTKNFTFVRTVYTEDLVLSASSKIEEAKEPHESLLSAFKVMRDYYQKIMWCVRDNEGSVYPIACDNHWDFSEAAWIQKLDFKTPNPFRIAKLTRKPFHGAVSKNSVSDLFFKLWNNGNYPDVFSVYPVVLGGKVFGYLIGCGKGPHFESQQSLETLEKVGHEILQSFLKIHKEFKSDAA